MMHSIAFGNGTLYPSGSSDHKEGQFKPTIGDTYADWFLIPQTRPTVAMPGTDTKFVSIPGRDGDLDMSDWLRKDRPAYKNRSGSFDFYVENDHKFWTTIFQEVHNKLHGRKCQMVLAEDDPGFYYEGRFAVSEEKSDQNWSTIKIQYSLNPWKMRIRKAADPMLWDTFNFESDYDYGPWGLSNLTVTDGATLNLWGEGYPWQPQITVKSGGPITVGFGGKSAVISTAGVTSGEIGRASYGNNAMAIIGSAVVAIDWRGGSL